jgi:ubiquinone/menaquinone biosynthesis C-methylase UbiE
MRYVTLLVLNKKPSRRQLRKFIGVSTIIARPGELPLQDESVDLVVVAGGLSSASPRYVGLAMLSRVLKDGAPLVILAPETSPIHAKLWLASTSLFNRKKNPPLTPEQLTGALLQAGFSHILQDKFSKLLPVMITVGHATHSSKLIANYFSPAPAFVSHSAYDEASLPPAARPVDGLPLSEPNRNP